MIYERSQRLILFDAHKIPYCFHVTPTLCEVLALTLTQFISDNNNRITQM